MDISKVKSLQVDSIVHCPEDRGEIAYSGKVEHIGQTVNTARNGVAYVWITVRKDNKTSHVWPSNRLG